MNDHQPYILFPFQFMRMPNEEILLVNEGGQFIFVSSDEFNKVINYGLDEKDQAFLDLKAKHFVTDTDILPVVDLLATKYRTKKGFMQNFTVLHMIVVTARCNHSCTYCHASSEPPDQTQWDMSPNIARQVVDVILRTPSPSIKIEFQGGEPLLNWETVKEVIQYAQLKNKKSGKKLEFVLCTNLTLINEDILLFLKANNVLMSISLDGPRDLHDKHRIHRDGGSSYDLLIKKLSLARQILGKEHISALMTTSKDSLVRLREVVDEYVKQGFKGIFLRPINPFGYAVKLQHLVGYDVGEFLTSYKDILRYIVELNLNGTYFEDYYTSLLLSRILTPFSTGFVDLQSPSGAGISGVIYDYNGDVYPCDEGRMLAKMGDKRFLMGNVTVNSYNNIFAGNVLREITGKSCVEILPGCAWCALQKYCGADPIRNYSEQGDITGHRPTSNFCKRNRAIIMHLLELIKDNNEDVMDVFWSWITKRPLEVVRHAVFSRKSS